MSGERPATRIFIEKRRASPAHPYGIGGFMMLSKAGLRELDLRLADRTLGMQAIRVLIAMAQSIDYENRAHMGQKDLAAHLGMAQQHVSASIRDLVACGFLERPETSRGYYRISPRLLWQGSARTLRAALAREAA